MSGIVIMKWALSCKVERIEMIRDVLIGEFKDRGASVQHASDAYTCQVTLDISGSPIDNQWSSGKYPG